MADHADLPAVLAELNMSNLKTKLLEEEKLDLRSILNCTHEELKTLGVTAMGDRIRLLEACNKKISNIENFSATLPSTATSAAASVVSTQSSSSGSRQAILNERSLLFSPYRRNRNGCRGSKKNVIPKFWTVQFICLADRYKSKVPSNYEKQQLIKAGLGPRKIKLNLDFNEEEVMEKLQSDILTENTNPLSFEGFPQLKMCGGYEILQCMPNSKDLAIINCSLATRLLKQKIGGSQAKIYMTSTKVVINETYYRGKGFL